LPCSDRVVPLVDVLAARVLRACVVQTDATGLKVLDPNSPENIQRSTVWCYVGGDRDVVFRYTPTGEGASGPWESLAGRRGYVQADAASVFDRLFNGQAASAVEVGCWAHARRKFAALSGVPDFDAGDIGDGVERAQCRRWAARAHARAACLVLQLRARR